VSVSVTREGWVRANAVEPILDLGCADSVYFDETVEFVGIDLDENSPDVVDGLPDRFIKADATQAPIESDSFRTVVLAEILEHLSNPPKAIAEARRIATDRVLVTVPDELNWQPAARPGQHDDHDRVYTDQLLAQHIMEGGAPWDTFEIGHIDQPPFAFWIAFISVDGG